MRVRLDFDRFYAEQEDPWGIGAADSSRYDLYRDRLLARAGEREAILDVGSGFGAFLARFRTEFARSVAVEVSAQAVAAGRARHPWIEFHQGSAGDLAATPADAERFSAIVLSDVIYYLDPAGRARALDWIARHLAPGGVALVAAYCPGRRYLTGDELRALVEERFAVEEEHRLESEHVALVVRPRRRLVALTVDYETWQPIPEGRRIEFQDDVFAPTEALLEAGVPLTLFAEMGEYLWLQENDPAVAGRMAEQWRDAVRRGHDVQLHLHPTWLPELGARREADGGWHWDWAYARADDFPGDLEELIGRCKRALEEAVPGHAVTCFRAGAYEAQPFRRLHDALVANGLTCDSSVYAGGRVPGRGYDYSLAYSDHQPYFAGRYDPQLKAPPAERGLVELPLLSTAPNTRWSFDATGGATFADELLGFLARGAAVTAERLRLAALARQAGNTAYALLPDRRWVNRLLPRRLAYGLVPYRPERLVADDYFVLIGHTKADLDLPAIRRGLQALAGEVEFVTLSEMAVLARADLERSLSRDRAEESERQVRREYGAVLSEQLNHRQSERLQAMIPRDRRRILDLGCGAGAWSRRIAEQLPWARVTGVDVGEDFIARAREAHASDRVDFAVQDFAALDFPDGTFDCVYADNSLEHAFDVDRTLAEVRRVLADGGVLVAALPSDARNPRRVCDNHTWKTAPHDVHMRLVAAGFEGVEITELDVYKRLGMSPYPPAQDRMMYVRAVKRPPAPARRAEELSRFVYDVLDPERPHRGEELGEILAGGSAWCTGYAVAAGLLLAESGFDVRWVTMIADGRPPTGEAEVDAHEVLEVELPGGERRVLDAMAGLWFDASLEELLADPARADVDRERDERYRARDYERYTTSAWYRRVQQVAVRPDPRDVQVFVAPSQVSRAVSSAPRRALRRARARLASARPARAARPG